MRHYSPALDPATGDRNKAKTNPILSRLQNIFEERFCSICSVLTIKNTIIKIIKTIKKKG